MVLCILVSSGPVEIPFNSILFEELLHKGTFKMVHHGVVNLPNQGILGVAVAVKRLKGTYNYAVRGKWQFSYSA